MLNFGLVCSSSLKGVTRVLICKFYPDTLTLIIDDIHAQCRPYCEGQTVVNSNEGKPLATDQRPTNQHTVNQEQSRK